MNIDFTGQIREMKERNVLHKPFPCFEGYALFTKNEEGQFVKLTFPNEVAIKTYLNALGYDWGNEGKDEFTNFDCENRLCTILPELEKVETVAAGPQWDPDKAPAETETKHESARTMEDIPHCAVELREGLNHSVTPVSNHPAHNEKLQASTTTSKKKLPPWMDKDKKEDKKNGKKGDEKGDKKGDKKEDKKEEGKDGKKLPPWMNKKKSKSKDYSDLYRKVSGEYGGPLKVGDRVKNVNKKCTHYGSEGVIKKFNDIPGDKGVTIAYQCTNAGKSWKEGDVLDKTPDQLEKKD